MSAQLDDPLTPELRDTLNNLAAGLFGPGRMGQRTREVHAPDQNLSLASRRPHLHAGGSGGDSVLRESVARIVGR